MIWEPRVQLHWQQKVTAETCLDSVITAKTGDSLHRNGVHSVRQQMNVLVLASTVPSEWCPSGRRPVGLSWCKHLHDTVSNCVSNSEWRMSPATCFCFWQSNVLVVYGYGSEWSLYTHSCSARECVLLTYFDHDIKDFTKKKELQEPIFAMKIYCLSLKNTKLKYWTYLIMISHFRQHFIQKPFDKQPRLTQCYWLCPQWTIM